MQQIVIAQDYYFWVPYDVLEMYFELKNWGKPNLYACRYASDNSDLHTEVETFRLDESDYNAYAYITNVDLGDSPDYGKIMENTFEPNEIKRDDPDLVQAVKDSKPGVLKVVEVPDGVKWYIDQEEGGWETIHEAHRSWS